MTTTIADLLGTISKKQDELAKAQNELDSTLRAVVQLLPQWWVETDVVMDAAKIGWSQTISRNLLVDRDIGKLHEELVRTFAEDLALKMEKWA